MMATIVTTQEEKKEKRGKRKREKEGERRETGLTEFMQFSSLHLYHNTLKTHNMSNYPILCSHEPVYFIFLLSYLAPTDIPN
jgi:hypothetical protein